MNARSFEGGDEPPKKNRRKSKKKKNGGMSDDETIDDVRIPLSQYGDGVPHTRPTLPEPNDEPGPSQSPKPSDEGQPAPSAPETQASEPKAKSRGRGKGGKGKGGKAEVKPEGGKGGKGGKGKAEVEPEPIAPAAESTVGDGKADGANNDGIVTPKPKANSSVKKKMTEAIHAGGRWFELKTTFCIAMANLEHDTNYKILCVFCGASGWSMIIYNTSEAEKQERLDALLAFDLTKDEQGAAHLRI